MNRVPYRPPSSLLALAAFVAPLLLYLATSSGSVQLDDGAEFVLCAREGGTPHPPGFPIWVMLAQAWSFLFGFLPSVTATCAFVATLSAAACALLFLTFDAVLAGPLVRIDAPGTRRASALLAALACATGATVWQWSNTAEVYSLQLLATALVLLGIARDDGAGWRWRIVTGLGLGIGLGNHHLSTVLLAPFLPSLVAALRRQTWSEAARSLVPAGAIALGVAALAYLLMMLRAGGDVAFTFGEPSSLSRLWHHLSGGFFGDSMWREGVDYEGRAAVLAMVFLRHSWVFLIALAAGVAWTWRERRGLALVLLGYPALLFFVQFGRMHTPNMDAGLLPALAVLSLAAALGLGRELTRRRGLLWLAVGGLALQLVLNLPAGSRRGYAPGDAVLADLEAALPERSILLATKWELQTIPLLARTERGWRPDLIVLPANLKGTHRDLLERNYPDFYAAVRPEYEAFLGAIAAVDPDYVYTDYNTFSTEAMQQTYAAMIQKVMAVARSEGRPVLCDRGTFKDLLAQKLVGQRVGTCGPLFRIDADTDSRPFVLPEGWLSHPFLAHDLCAIGMLHEYVTVSKQMAGYWKARGERRMAETAAVAAEALERIWKDYLVGKPGPRQ